MTNKTWTWNKRFSHSQHIGQYCDYSTCVSQRTNWCDAQVKRQLHVCISHNAEDNTVITSVLPCQMTDFFSLYFKQCDTINLSANRVFGCTAQIYLSTSVAFLTVAAASSSHYMCDIKWKPKVLPNQTGLKCNYTKYFCRKTYLCYI